MMKKNKKSKFQEDLERYVTRMLRVTYDLRFESYDIAYQDYCIAFNNNFHTRGLKDKTFKTIMKPVKDKLLLACYHIRNKVFIIDFEEYQKAVLEKLNTLKGDDTGC